MGGKPNTNVWSSVRNSLVTQQNRQPNNNSHPQQQRSTNQQNAQTRKMTSRPKFAKPSKEPSHPSIQTRKILPRPQRTAPKEKHSTKDNPILDQKKASRDYPNQQLHQHVKNEKNHEPKFSIQTNQKEKSTKPAWPTLQSSKTGIDSRNTTSTSTLTSSPSSSHRMRPSAPIFVSSAAIIHSPPKSALPETSGWAKVASHPTPSSSKQINANATKWKDVSNSISTNSSSKKKPKSATAPPKLVQSNISIPKSTPHNAQKQASEPTLADLMSLPVNKKTKKSKVVKTNAKLTPSTTKKVDVKAKNIKNRINTTVSNTHSIASSTSKVPLPDQRMDNFFLGKNMLQSKITANKPQNKNTFSNNCNTNAVIVKGKQRVKPRKKKLSTLKKKVLQERLRQWKEFNEKKKQLTASSGTTDSAINAESKTEIQTVPISNVSNSSNIICLHNYVSPEELEDDDEYEEISSDLMELSVKIGPVSNITIPRKIKEHQNTNIGLAFVSFEKQEDAKAALECWSNMLIGGNRIQTLMVDSVDLDWKQVHDYFTNESNSSTHLEKSVSLSSNATNPCIIILENIITEEDMEDEESLEECKEDIRLLVSEHGSIYDLIVHTEGAKKGLVYLTYKGTGENSKDNLDVSNAAIERLNGIKIGGQIVQARLLFHPTTATENLPILIKLDNILTEDDYIDDDCFEESKDDVISLLEKYGSIQSMSIQRSEPDQGVITISFHGGLEVAKNAVNHLNGMILGGQPISAIISTNSQTEEISTGISTGINNNAQELPSFSTIVINHMLNDDDFDDKECFEETKCDIESMVSKYGTIQSLTMETSGVHKGLVFVTYSGDMNDNIDNTVKNMDGSLFGGISISAKIMAPTVTKCNVKNEAPRAKIEPTMEEEKSQDKISTLNPNAPMYSGTKIIPQRYAECKLVPKIPNSGVPREYASRIPDDSAVTLLIEMLGGLMKFQLRSKDDANARARRRLVLGLREVARGIRSHKVKMVVMANNLDTYGAIDTKLEEILHLAKQEDVPVLFEFNKRKLGKALGKSIKVSVVGVQNADGAHEQFKKLKKLCLLPRVPSS